MSHRAALDVLAPSCELKHVWQAGRDGAQLLEGERLTSSSHLRQKSRPILKQHERRVKWWLGHNHKKMSRAKRDTFPNIPQLPLHSRAALPIDFTLKVKTP